MRIPSFAFLSAGLSALLFLNAAVSAQTEASDFNLAPVSPGLKEILGDTALSSGAAVHGVQLRLPPGVTQRDLNEVNPLIVHLPKAWLNEQEACLQTGSIDGRYAAGATYAWASAIAGPQAARYESREQDYLSLLKPGELAISLTRNACEEQSIWAGSQSEPLEISVASWRHGFEGAEVVVLVNGFASDRVTIEYGPETTRDCVPVTAETRSAYNLSCILPLKDLLRFVDPEKHAAPVVLRNYTLGVAGRETWLSLFLPEKAD